MVKLNVTGLIMGAIALIILFNIAPDLMHQVQIGVTEIQTELTNTTLYGTSPGTLAGDLEVWSGYMWLGIVVLVVFTGVLGFFGYKKYGRRRRR